MDRQQNGKMTGKLKTKKKKKQEINSINKFLLKCKQTDKSFDTARTRWKRQAQLIEMAANENGKKINYKIYRIQFYHIFFTGIPYQTYQKLQNPIISFNPPISLANFAFIVQLCLQWAQGQQLNSLCTHLQIIKISGKAQKISVMAH